MINDREKLISDPRDQGGTCHPQGKGVGWGWGWGWGEAAHPMAPYRNYHAGDIGAAPPTPHPHPPQK